MFINQSGKSIIDQIREKKDSNKPDESTGDIDSLNKLADSLGRSTDISDPKLAEEIKNSFENKN